jgi:hypothetical protein
MPTYFCAGCEANMKNRNVWWLDGKPYCLSCTVDQLRTLAAQGVGE